MDRHDPGRYLDRSHVAPTFGGACKAGGFFATVKTSGCFLRFYNLAKVKADVYGSTFELECEPNKGIEVQMFAAADEKVAFATMTGEVTFTGDSGVTPTEAVDVEISG